MTIPPLAGLFGYRRLHALAAEPARRSDQAEWWPAFLAAMRAGAPQAGISRSGRWSRCAAASSR